jgi:type-F conjugative transfer system pilin assembly protein TrbC
VVALIALGAASITFGLIPLGFAQPQAPDTAEVLQDARDAMKDPVITDQFNRALENSRRSQFPDTRGLMRWLRSQPAAATGLDALLEGGDRLREQNTTAEAPRYESRMFVFVSFSMPETALRNLFNAAAPHGIPLVLRGFVGAGDGSAASLGATQKRLVAVFGESLGKHKRGGILIDPTLFHRFDIRQVPAFVATTETPKTCDQENCEAPENYQLFGDVTLDFALERLIRKVPDLEG